MSGSNPALPSPVLARALPPVPEPAAPSYDKRTRQLLEAPVLTLLLRMAWPNVIVMVLQASSGLVETYWVSKLGTDALAGMALVFPPVLLMTMISAGALGGGISSAVARALGAGQRDDANALVLHAAALNIALGLLVSAVFLAFGRPIYRAMGGDGGALEAALVYSNALFLGNVLIWLMNGLASVIRGTGDILYPALVTLVGVVALVPLSPLLIYGAGPIPAMGIAGAALALLLFFGAGTCAMAWRILAGRGAVRLRGVALQWRLFRGILRVGAISTINSIQSNLVIAGATALVGRAGGTAALAGYGTGARLEFLLIPLIFGIGAPMVALVGTNIGAGQPRRAERIALTGALLAFAVTEAIGVAASLWPARWLSLFSDDPAMLASGSDYLRIVGPVYGFFGIGLSLYFASQGAGRLLWPLIGSLLRFVFSLAGGGLLLAATGEVRALYAALALGLVGYGTLVLIAVRRGSLSAG